MLVVVLASICRGGCPNASGQPNPQADVDQTELLVMIQEMRDEIGNSMKVAPRLVLLLVQYPHEGLASSSTHLKVVLLESRQRVG